MTPPTLTTERLTLRAHRRDDFDAYAELWASPEAKFMGGPLARDEAWGAFCSDFAGWDLLGCGAWAVDHTASGATIGQVAINDLPSFPEKELGWLTYAAHRGKGYAAEAAAKARDYAFEGLSFDTLVSYIDPDNGASIAVATKLGASLDNDAKGPDPTDLVYRHPNPKVLS
ncbi:MAG: GNAT family N-acetyltransferase [Pseudomonadota bacterium]